MVTEFTACGGECVAVLCSKYVTTISLYHAICCVSDLLVSWQVIQVTIFCSALRCSPGASFALAIASIAFCIHYLRRERLFHFIGLQLVHLSVPARLPTTPIFGMNVIEVESGV